MNRGKKILIITGMAFVIILIASLVLILKPKHQQTTTTPSGLEKGSAASYVGFNGTERLNQILLPEQLSSVEKALSAYIRANIGNDIVSADIVPGTTIVNSDGSVNFTVKTTNPLKTFGVVLQRPSIFEIIFYVPSSNSESTILYPFNQ